MKNTYTRDVTTSDRTSTSHAECLREVKQNVYVGNEISKRDEEKGSTNFLLHISLDMCVCICTRALLYASLSIHIHTYRSLLRKGPGNNKVAVCCSAESLHDVIRDADI